MQNIIKKIPGGICAALGFKASGVASGVKKNHKLDLALIVSDVAAVAAGVFTKNKLAAAPVVLSKKHLKAGLLQAIVINSGNANACTGKTGMQDCKVMAQTTATQLKIDPTLVAVASTGVIGVPLQINKVVHGIKLASPKLSSVSSLDAASAILTTDTFTKEIAVTFTLGNKKVTIGGIAKGSGMIHPNMATMLAFITSDVNIEVSVLQHALKQVTNETFNMISVDGDSSTNDMLIILANKLAKNKLIKDTQSVEYLQFYQALKLVCTDLAKQIIADGEGASKTFEVNVTAANSLKQAQTIAKSVASSTLVKAALFGNDANWGRIACAVGYANTNISLTKMMIMLDDLVLFADGIPTKFDEVTALGKLKQDNVIINIDLGVGAVNSTAWGCDLSYDYIKINASYRS